jgi:hypothetical protein
MEIKQGYKVCYAEPSGGLWSVTYWMESIRNVRYVHGWNVPNPEQGPLCIFDTENNTRGFMLNVFTPNLVVFLCYYIPSVHDSVWWSKGNGRHFNYLDLPTGTILADAVYLLNEV